MSHRYFFCAVVLSVATLALTRCGGGDGIGVFKVEPPVTANTPAGFKAVARLAGEIDVIQDRFFAADGPTVVSKLLSGVDSRMAEIDERSKESTRPCLSETPKAFDITTPIALNFEQHLSCVDNFSTDHWMAFGQKDGIWYLREGQTNGMGTFAKVDASENVEAWLIVADKDTPGNSQSLMHLKSTKATGILEFTVTGNSIGVGCGVQYRSNADFIYTKGDFTDPACGGALAELCLNASDLNNAAGGPTDCTSTDLDEFELDPLTPATIAFGNIHELGSQKVTGITAF